jgi:hypothetical protein
MRIIFTKDGGNPVCEMLAASKDHWDACLIGHQMLIDGLAADADDFIVTPIVCTRAEVDANATSLLEKRCG